MPWDKDINENEKLSKTFWNKKEWVICDIIECLNRNSYMIYKSLVLDTKCDENPCKQIATKSHYRIGLCYTEEESRGFWSFEDWKHTKGNILK